MKKARMVVVGDEILIGQIVDTNSATAAKLLATRGVALTGIAVVGDSEDRIVAALRDASDADLVIVSGGLGPTHDDRTRFAVAQFLGTDIRIRPDALAELEAMFAQAGRTLNEANRVQVMIPDGADHLSNRVGTAPGLRFHNNQTTFFCFQGVPGEFRWMCETYVLPFLGDAPAQPAFEILRTFGIPESTLYQHVKPLVDEWKDVWDVAFLPQLESGVDIRITARSRERDARTAAQLCADAIERRYPHSVYARGIVSMEEVVARQLWNLKWTIATAESCTGGLISHRLTNVSGSSAYFIHGIVAYANASKTGLLDVPRDVIERFGAVSEETVRAMAEGIRTNSRAEIGLATTGIAGPTGGTDEKPVGTLFVGLATPDGASAIRGMPLPFQVDRINFKQRAAQIALNLLREYLVTKET